MSGKTASSVQSARVILWGLGALGKKVLTALQDTVQPIEIVGAVDWDPRLAGRDLSQVFSQVEESGVAISPSLEQCVENLGDPADVVYHMTRSEVPIIEPQLELALSHNLNVISAAESMFHPRLRYADAAVSLDRAAKQHGVSITGCGINPGFVFDALVLVLSRVSTAITRVETSRVIEVAGTGPGDIQHVGFGLWPEEFEEKISTGEIVGHMGMPESISAVAERIGLPIDQIEERWEPTTSSFAVESAIGTLEPGRVTGIIQQGLGFVGGREAIKMRLLMFYDPERHGYEQKDEIIIEGSHSVHNTSRPALVSILGAGLTMINTTFPIMEAAPGLHSVLDFGTGGPYRGGFRLALDADRQTRPGTVWLVQKPVKSS